MEEILKDRRKLLPFLSSTYKGMDSDIYTEVTKFRPIGCEAVVRRLEPGVCCGARPSFARRSQIWGLLCPPPALAREDHWLPFAANGTGLRTS